jgi:hypothetical protein
MRLKKIRLVFTSGKTFLGLNIAIFENALIAFYAPVYRDHFALIVNQH